MDASHANRLSAIRRAVARARVDVFVVMHPPNTFYLSGFSGSSGALLVGRGRPVLFTDGRYSTQAGQEARGVKIVIHREALLTAVGEYLRESKTRRIAFEPAHLTVAQFDAMRRAASKSLRWMPLPSAVEYLRAIKSVDELATMRRAARLVSRAFQEVLPLVKPGVRETELAAEVEYRMRRLGASGPSFETIIASGKRSALPHAQPTDKRLRKNELVVFDLGAILGHYCSDLTRTVFLGRAPSRIRNWYRAVGEAQAAAGEALRPGVTAGEVDAAARGVLKQFGLEQYFVHSLGHGLGLEIHEDPRLARGQERRIAPGNVVTLEPGVYVPEVGGIRIEDDVAVLSRSNEVLTDAHRELLEL
jgi:Xaa-Pro aminopeptidase